MAVAKVTLNGTTLMDTTDATADASKILSTYTAYIGDGSKVTGTASGGHVTQDQDGYIILPKTGGGGGSSDFSTATVTLNLIPPQGISIIGELVDVAFNYGNDLYRDDYAQVTNHNAEVVLYEGTGFIYSLMGQYIDPEYPDEPQTIWADNESATTTGDVVWDSSVGDWGAFVVTGDGTITANLIFD